MNDISVEDFADILCLLDPLPEVTKAFDRWGTKSYNSQKAHMVIWFQSQTGTGGGAYTRDSANYSARTCYNRLLNPGALLWIADALGMDAETIKKATEATKEAEKQNYRKRCGAFREVIPFDSICALLEKPKEWRLDPELLPYLDYDADGYAVIKKGKNTDVELVLAGELE